jgi:hypothetical protein
MKDVTTMLDRVHTRVAQLPPPVDRRHLLGALPSHNRSSLNYPTRLNYVAIAANTLTMTNGIAAIASMFSTFAQIWT